MLILTVTRKRFFVDERYHRRRCRRRRRRCLLIYLLVYFIRSVFSFVEITNWIDAARSHVQESAVYFLKSIEPSQKQSKAKQSKERRE